MRDKILEGLGALKAAHEALLDVAEITATLIQDIEFALRTSSTTISRGRWRRDRELARRREQTGGPHPRARGPRRGTGPEKRLSPDPCRHVRDVHPGAYVGRRKDG